MASETGKNIVVLNAYEDKWGSTERSPREIRTIVPLELPRVQTVRIAFVLECIHLRETYWLRGTYPKSSAHIYITEMLCDLG